MTVDILVYGVVAAGLVFWLRSILGTKHGDERERPNPLMGQQAQDGTAKASTEMAAIAGEKALSPLQRISELAQYPKGAFGIENKTAENGLLEIARAEKSFDIDFFGQAAQDVFVMIVEAFAKGERETLEDLLSKDVYNAFEAAITAREKSGEKLESEIHAIKKAQIIAAMVEKKTAFITVRFTADETRVTRDAAGSIISGHPDRISSMVDIWTFSHDLSGRDPRWLLVETRSDDADDNDLVPDTAL